ncbi:hypothetical protein ACMV5I_28630 [Serratia sp. T13T92]|uniref:hypothetical protein n=1 Tax=Serratia sp. T13T92 TaxID=3397496 RepID=UPI0039DFF294
MSSNKSFIIVILAGLLVGCAAVSPDLLVLQNHTASKLGLASTDEVILTNLHQSEPNAFNGRTIMWDAKTAKGRQFQCSLFVTPPLNPLEKVSYRYQDVECQPR